MLSKEELKDEISIWLKLSQPEINAQIRCVMRNGEEHNRGHNFNHNFPEEIMSPNSNTPKTISL